MLVFNTSLKMERKWIKKSNSLLSQMKKTITITSLEEASLDACMCYVCAKLSHFYYYISNISVVPYSQINSTEKKQQLFF